MPRDSNGTTTPLPGTIVSLGQTIQPSQHNPMVEDLYAMMTQSLSRDGQGGMRTNLDMGGFRVRNLEAPSLPNDAVRKAEFDVTAAKANEVDLKLAILQPSVDVASATTTDIGAAASQNVRITGTTTITSFGTAAAGTFRRLRFAASLVLTYNATSLILPGGVSITTAAGDIAEFISEGSGNWRCVGYTYASPFIANQYLHVRDQKAQNTSGGNSIAGSQQRTLNTTVVNTISGATLSSNNVSLPAGVYEIDAIAPCYRGDRHKIFLQVAGGGAVLAVGSNQFSGGADTTQTTSTLKCQLTLASTTSISLNHYIQTAQTSGLGLETNVAPTVPEVYAEFFAKRIA